MITFKTDDNDVLLSAAKLLKPNGCIVQVKSTASRPFHIAGLKRGVTVHNVDLRSYFDTQHTGTLSRLKELVAQGIENEAVTPLPMKVFKEGELQEAFTALADNHHKTKVVVKVRNQMLL